jgi:hypothetical protein
MRRIGAVLVGVALALAACDRGEETDPRPDADTDATTVATSDDKQEDERTAAVYAAVVRQLVTEDHTFGGGPAPFERVFIVDGAVPRASNPMPLWREPPRPFAPAVRAGIIEQLADLPPVEFVSNPDSVVAGRRECAHVKRNGVLITLGPIKGDSDKATVPNGLFFACLGGQWLTYKLERTDEDWRVTGTKGPYIIS